MKIISLTNSRLDEWFVFIPEEDKWFPATLAAAVTACDNGYKIRLGSPNIEEPNIGC